jgi:heat shock protein HslJ
MIRNLFTAVLLLSILTGCNDNPVTEDNALSSSPMGSWSVIALGDTALIPENFEDELPGIVLSPDEGIVSGFDGCNRFNGTISVEGNQIRFSELASTRRYCQNMEVIDQIMAAFSGKTVDYEIIGNELLLKSGGVTILSLIRTD